MASRSPFMHLISSILFGLSANVDSFVIGVSYGLKKVHITLAVNLVIGFITFLGTLLSISLGEKLLFFFPPAIAKYIGCGVLIFLGFYYLIIYLIKKEPSELKTADIFSETPTTLSWKEAISVSLALTLNNAGMGVGASISGIPLISTSLLSFLFSASFLFWGNKLGKSSLLLRLSKYAEPASGLLIILLGIYELLI